MEIKAAKKMTLADVSEISGGKPSAPSIGRYMRDGVPSEGFSKEVSEGLQRFLRDHDMPRSIADSSSDDDLEQEWKAWLQELRRQGASGERQMMALSALAAVIDRIALARGEQARLLGERARVLDRTVRMKDMEVAQSWTQVPGESDGDEGSGT